MKIAFIVHNEFMSDRIMQLLAESGIDYYTRWEQVQGKGRGTEPHIGSGRFVTMNTVLMIGFRETEPLDTLITKIIAANDGIERPDDKILLFQLPMERMV
jgi:nitrogen regulatory protein PII